MEQGHDSDEDDGSNALDEDRLILGNLWVSIVDGKVDSILLAQGDEVSKLACELDFAIGSALKDEVGRAIVVHGDILNEVGIHKLDKPGVAEVAATEEGNSVYLAWTVTVDDGRSHSTGSCLLSLRYGFEHLWFLKHTAYLLLDALGNWSVSKSSGRDRTSENHGGQGRLNVLKLVVSHYLLEVLVQLGH